MMKYIRRFSLVVLSASFVYAVSSGAIKKPAGLGEMPYYELPEPLALPTETNLENATLQKKFDYFVEQGVPEEPLRKIFAFYAQSFGHQIKVKADNQFIQTPFKNDRYMGIADYTLQSTEKRFYLMDLKTGRVEKHYVSHGANSGFNWAQLFSNEHGSKKSSLGLYITGNTYPSPAFKSPAMKVFGLEPSNYNAFARSVVIHQAYYASPNFIQDLQQEQKKDSRIKPRLGRSFGCFAFDPQVAQEIINKLKGGALIYSYVRGAETQMALTPQFQEVIRVNPAYDVGIDTEEELAQKALPPRKK